MRRRIHSSENRFPSGSIDLARRIRVAALDARHCEAYCLLRAADIPILVPNPFYLRVSKAPFTDASTFNFQNADDMAKAPVALMASVNAAEQCTEKDRQSPTLPSSMRKKEA